LPKNTALKRVSQAFLFLVVLFSYLLNFVKLGFQY